MEEKERIKEWIVRDIKSVHVLIVELLNSKDALDALVEVFYKRYVAMHESKSKHSKDEEME